MNAIMLYFPFFISFFFFNDTAPTEIYTLSLHDALPICARSQRQTVRRTAAGALGDRRAAASGGCHRAVQLRSEEHTSELQSRLHLVCRLLLEKKKKKNRKISQIKTTRNIQKKSTNHDKK